MLLQRDLKRLIVGFPERPPLTTRLEKTIRIGTGFHNRWYSSQREHWLGWLTAKEREVRAAGLDTSRIAAGDRWRYLNCLPMMFWLAECAPIAPPLLEAAQHVAVLSAAEVQHDCPQHGRAMRGVLPWRKLEVALLEAVPNADDATAAEAGERAFARFAAAVPGFGRLDRPVRQTTS